MADTSFLILCANAQHGRQTRHDIFLVCHTSSGKYKPVKSSVCVMSCLFVWRNEPDSPAVPNTQAAPDNQPLQDKTRRDKARQDNAELDTTILTTPPTMRNSIPTIVRTISHIYQPIQSKETMIQVLTKNQKIPLPLYRVSSNPPLLSHLSPHPLPSLVSTSSLLWLYYRLPAFHDHKNPQPPTTPRFLNLVSLCCLHLVVCV